MASGWWEVGGSHLTCFAVRWWVVGGGRSGCWSLMCFFALGLHLHLQALAPGTQIKYSGTISVKSVHIKNILHFFSRRLSTLCLFVSFFFFFFFC